MDRQTRMLYKPVATDSTATPAVVVVGHQRQGQTEPQVQVETAARVAQHGLGRHTAVVVVEAAMEPGQLVEPAVVGMGVAVQPTLPGHREPQIPAVAAVGHTLALVLAGLVVLA